MADTLAADPARVDALLQEHLPAGGELSLAALAAASDALARRTDKVKANMFSLVKDFYSNSKLATGEAAECDKALIALPNEVEPNLPQCAFNHQRVDLQMRAADAALVSVWEIVSLGSAISKYNGQMERGQLSEAARTLKQQHESIAKLLSLERAEGLELGPDGRSLSSVIAGLQDDVDARSVSLSEELKSLLRDSVEINVRAEGGGRLGVRAEMCEVELTTVWAGLEALELLEPVFEDWLSDMQEMFSQVLRGSHTTTKPRSQKHSAKDLVWDALNTTVESKVPTKAVVRAVCSVLEFIAEEVLCSNTHLVSVFSAVSWPMVAEQVVLHWLHPLAPQEPADLVQFRQASKCATELVQQAAKLGLALETKTIQTAIDSMEAQYAVGRRRWFLSKARAIAITPGYDTVTVGASGTNSLDASSVRDGTSDPCNIGSAEEALLPEGYACPMQMERCQISLAAYELGDLAQTVLQEACISESKILAMELCTAVMEVMDLFRSVVPVVRAKDVGSAPHLGMLYRNDCHYLSLHMLSLHFRFGGQVQKVAGVPLPLAGLAPSMRSSGDHAESKCVEKIESGVIDVLDQIGALQCLADEDANAAAHRGVQQALHLVRCAAAAWRPMLPNATACNALAHLYNTICKRFVDSVLAMKDISVEETASIRELLGVVIECDALQQDDQKSDSNTEGATDTNTTASAILAQVPNWIKMRELAQLMDAPLKDITNRWEEGRLQACGFAAVEVRGLICAIFETTPLRKECLESIHDDIDYM